MHRLRGALGDYFEIDLRDECKATMKERNAMNKAERKLIETREKAFWELVNPSPAFNKFLSNHWTVNERGSESKEKKTESIYIQNLAPAKQLEYLQSRIAILNESLGMQRAKASISVKAVIKRCKLYTPADPFFGWQAAGNPFKMESSDAAFPNGPLPLPAANNATTGTQRSASASAGPTKTASLRDVSAAAIFNNAAPRMSIAASGSFSTDSLNESTSGHPVSMLTVSNGFNHLNLLSTLFPPPSKSGAQRKPPKLNKNEQQVLVPIWSESLKDLLSSAMGLTFFKIFLGKEFSTENLAFWLRCVVELDRASTRVGWWKIAHAIYVDFIKLGSTNELNINSGDRQAIIKKFDSITPDGKIPPVDEDLFTSVREHIWNLMVKDSYQRFLSSDIFKELKQQQQDQPLFQNVIGDLS